MKMKFLFENGFDRWSADQLEELLEKVQQSGVSFDNGATVRPIAGDASDRKFFRIQDGTRSYIALVAPRRNVSGMDENDSYFLIGRHLHEKGLPVPRIIWSDLQQGHFLLQDLGDLHLQRYINQNRAKCRAVYRRVLEVLVKLHRAAPEGFAENYCFDTSLYSPSFVYERELQYFRGAFLNDYLGVEVSEEDVRKDFEDLAEAAGVHESSFVLHRDFQSRNILIHRGRLWILDFQGMRFGPPLYDLASLLMDPYVFLPERMQEDFARVYRSAAKDILGCSGSRFWDAYWAVRLSRNLQVLGAYAFIGLVKNKKSFFQYIPPAWWQLWRLLNGRCRGRYPQLERLVNKIHSSKTVLLGQQRLKVLRDNSAYN